jgi:hypothetical protein
VKICLSRSGREGSSMSNQGMKMLMKFHLKTYPLAIIEIEKKQREVGIQT